MDAVILVDQLEAKGVFGPMLGAISKPLEGKNFREEADSL